MKEAKPWELIHDKTISQLVFAYEMVLTEMRTHARANRTIKEWVERLDSERDEFVQSMLVKPDEPPVAQCEHDLLKPNHTITMTHDLREGMEGATITTCRVCKQQWRHPNRPAGTK